MNNITDKQKQVLQIIKKHIAKKGFPPTVREIGEEMNLSSPASTQFHLNKLEDFGYIKKNKNKFRSLELLVENEFLNEDSDTVHIPLIGTITAGNPIEAIENPFEYFPVPINLIPLKKEVFALNISGNSMINKGIKDKDIVILERKNIANNGDIIAALLNENEVTLKTFYKEKDHVRLQPENEDFEPIIIDDISILGKAIGLYRKID